MSYHGTVRCGYCGTRGHNKRSCPDLTKLMEEWKKSDDPYYQKRAERLQERRKTRPKRCSHCGETGHTIRTCDRHNAQVDSVAQSWLDARCFVKDKMHEHGFGVGSLVQIKRSRWCSDAAETIDFTDLVVVIDIKHDTITNRALTNNAYFRRSTPVIYNYVTGDQAGTTFYGTLPWCVVDKGPCPDYYGENEYAKHKENCVLVSSTEAATPNDFLEWDKIRRRAYKHSRGEK